MYYEDGALSYNFSGIIADMAAGDRLAEVDVTQREFYGICKSLICIKAQ